MTNPAPRTWPLLAPGMPPPGPDFVAHAAALGDTDTKAGKRKSDGIVAVGPLLQRLYDRCLLQPGFEVPVRLGPGRVEPVAFIPGGRWGDRHGVWLAPDADDPNRPLPGPGRGPVPSKVMVIGKMPGPEEERFGRALCGPAAACLLESLQMAHAEGVADWYTTNLVKFRPPLPSTNVQAAWRADCLPLLQMEIRLVRPELILCLGADALQAVLGKGAKVGDLDGRVETLKVPCGREPGSEEFFECRVTAVVSPAEVLRDVGRRRQFDAQIARVAALAAGRRWDVADTDVDHRLCTTLEQADAWLAEAEAHLATLEPKDRWVAWDAEWHGSHPVNAGSYLRTVQISWREKQAVVFALTRQGGEPCLPAAPLAERLNRFMRGKRAVGHFLVADLEWLHHYGFRPTDDCPMPLDPGPGGEAAWERWRAGEGWADTGLLAHCIEETAELGLDALATRYCGVHRYDLPLAEWRDRYCAEHGIKRAALEGYGECPNSTLEGELQADGYTLKDSYACLHGESLVQLADGSWEKIGRLVKRRYSGEVKALVDGEVVNSRVTNWHRAEVGQKDWFKLRTATTVDGRWSLIGPALTPDHKVVTQRGKVRVDELVVGQDAVATDEYTFTPEQRSVWLACMLGDGGLNGKNGVGVAFGFGQRAAKREYLDWKARVFAGYRPSPVKMKEGLGRYVTPFHRYFAWLMTEYPRKPACEHRHRKLIVTRRVLDELGLLGLAVWYQDDGTLATDKRCPTHMSSRIYAKLRPEEAELVVGWLSRQFGEGVTYNARNRFVQIAGAAFAAFHRAINPYLHPAMGYKTHRAVGGDGPVLTGHGPVFHETVLEVCRWTPSSKRRGNGVRYCLTVADAGNFLTSVGFVSNCFDSDVTLRLVRKLLPLVERDYDGNCVWEPAWASMLTCEPILAIHKAGIAVDRARLDELTDVFRTARAALEEEIQSDKWANWPDLNLRSILQVKELLFGERHGKKDKDTGQPVRQRPDGAVSLELTPTLTTGRRQRPWADVVERGQEKDYAPSTNKVALGLLIADAPTEFAGELVGKVRDHRYLDQVLKGFLRDPLAPDEEGGDEPAEEATPTLVLADGTPVSSADAGFYEYDGGLATFIDDDGRVRTHLYPTTDSSRLRSARPNLQNASKSRDDDFRKLLGSAYKHKLRSVFTAGPGRVLIERDYKTAELFILSIMAGDAVMEDHCRRANLPESGFDAAGREVPGGKYPHPDFYDIHSNVAVLAFRLTVNDFVHLSEPEDRGKPGFGKTCAELLGLPVGAPLPANKAAFKYAGLAKFRTLAKAVLFGLCYGRGAKAIAMQARMEGVRGVGVFEAERIIRTIFDLYPGLERFFAACRARVVDPGYIVNPHGRIRRFPRTADRGALADAERQAMNYVPQSEVADLSHRAMARLQRAIVEHGLEGDVALVLQIHDALLVECREDPALIDYVANTLMPYAMTHSNPILQCDLDGRPTGREAVYLETDCEIMSRWGVKYDGPVTAAVAA